MYRIAVVGDRDSVYGFAALGLSVFPAEDETEGARVLRRLVERGKLGFQHTRRAFRFRALQAVRADQLGAQAGFMHGRALFGAHFHKADREPSVR